MLWRRRDPKQKVLDIAKDAYAAGSRAVQAGRLEEAVAAFERAVTLLPSWVEARINLGSLCYQLSQTAGPTGAQLWLEKAETQFREALARQPDHLMAVASLNLAATLDGLGRHDEALAQLEQLAAEQPAIADVQYNLAIAYARAGRVEDARAAARRELAAQPKHTAARGLLEKLGD